VLKAIPRGADGETDYARTAAVVGLARAAGAPVAEVLAADTTCRLGPWQYLVQEHVPGVEWRRVRPLLGGQELDAAHRQIAEAVLAVQSVRFDAYGELDQHARPVGATLVDSLRRRASTRIADLGGREVFLRLLDEEADLFTVVSGPTTLCHDDLHHGNVIFRAAPGGGWQLSGVLDWDKAWAGPAESDVARMAFWDDMTGPGFWEVYRGAVPATDGFDRRMLIYQLLWCLEHGDTSDRHRSDTDKLRARLG